jgi:glycine dehydrogenase subunit 1
MAFIPHTEEEQKLMLERIGVNSFDELIAAIPEEIRLKNPLNLNKRLSEFEVVKLLENYSSKNSTPTSHTCFIGGGAYDHFIPSVVGMVLSRSEFKTAYTPYQAEVSQGTLQAMYEFQSMICALTGMDVSNASLYDGGTSLAEACLMAQAHNRKSEFLIAGTINPYYLETIKTITAGRNITFKTFINSEGTAHLDALKSAISSTTSGVIVQHPNFYGTLEEVEELEKITHDAKALFIVSSCPFSMGILKTPGEYNADILVGEGQPLGIPLSFGGPYLGIFATKNEFVRKLPGRLSGVTVDTDGKRCYVLTLQTREQQIKRDKATSNICTNQGLFMLAATVYMETMGKQGVADVARQSYEKAVYLSEKISSLKGYTLFNNKPFFREFLVKTPVDPEEIIKVAHDKGFLAGINTGRFDGYEKGLLVAVTEKRTKSEMDDFVDFLATFSK